MRPWSEVEAAARRFWTRRPVASTTILLWFLGAAFVSARADGVAKVFPHLSRIRYDGQCLTIDDQDTFIFCAPFQYDRIPKAQWRERFKAIKAAGRNAVETEVDGSAPAGVADLRDWLRMAADEFGLYTIVRADRGKLLLPRFWPAIAAEQITRQPDGHPGVILVQIEANYDAVTGIFAADRLAHLRGLYQAATAGGIEVPTFTSGTRECRDSDDPLLSQVFDALSLAPAADLDSAGQSLANLEAAQPDAPAMILEPEVAPEWAAPQAVEAIMGGATIIAAPVASPGGPLDAIGHLLKREGESLARSKPIQCQVETASFDVTVSARRTLDHSVYLFFRNRSDHTRQRALAVIWIESAGEFQVNYDLPPAGFSLLHLSPRMKWPLAPGESIPAAGAKLPAGVEWVPN